MLNLNKERVIMQKNISELKRVLTDFLIREYGQTDDETKRDMQELEKEGVLQIIYTTLGDNGELEIEVFVNIKNNRLEQVVYGVEIHKIELTEYGTLENMVTDLKGCNFEDLIRLDKYDVDDLIIEDKKIVSNI